MQAELRISDIVTDSSSISATLTGVLTYHAVYQVILETDSAYGGLPYGDYDLQIWNSGSLVATTGYTFYDSSSSTSPPPDSSEMNDSSYDSSKAKSTTDIQVVDGVGYGILDMRTEKARELVTQSAKIPVTVLIYDWLNQYLLVRLSTTLYRNEAGI